MSSSGLVEHLERLEKNDPSPEKVNDPSVPDAQLLQPSEIIAEYLKDKTFKHEGLEYLVKGDCLNGFAVLGMYYQHGALFNRAIRSRRQLEKLAEDLKDGGF